MKVYDSLTALIGHTPLLRLRKIEEELGLEATLLAKVEYFNPGGSVKDRVALAMIQDAEEHGILQPGGTIIEPTSGNTGIGLAWVGASRGYRVILTMPETMSIERRKLVAAYGAEVVLTPGAQGMKGAIAKAEELLREIPGAWMPSQFSNPANPERHYRTTAQEIWDDTAGQVHAFVAGIGTGGTISGVGKGLKEHNEAIDIIGVEPAASPVINGGQPGPHKLQGIGAGFIPDNLWRPYVDEVLTVTNEAAVEACRRLATQEGLLVGYSSGAAVHAATEVARRPEMQGKVIVALLPDTGDRYLSTDLFA